MIQMISIEKIHHHPDNPRKDLGDLTELAESIKQSGILQNLTLVPWFSTITKKGADNPRDQEELGYYAVIGNRRLAAAKLADLKEVPAVIREDMDHKTQIATMLLENMQRSDLTVYEQAQGFQMMMDFGESIAEISEKTGFSDSTVRRRMKLLELDQDKLKETAVRGATLKDYMELEKIEDLEIRNKVLEKIGTNDFNYELKKAIQDEEKKKKREGALISVKEFATEIKDTENTRYKGCYFSDWKDAAVPEDVDEIEYFYKVEHGGAIYLYTEKEEDGEADKINTEKEKAKEERRSRLEEITKRAYELRKDFVKNLSYATVKREIGVIAENAIYLTVEEHGYTDYERIIELLDINIDLDENEELEIKDIKEKIHDKPEMHLLATVFTFLDNGNNSNNYFDWRLEYSENGRLDKVYDLLTKLGYKISEEEAAMMDGSHELYIKSKDK